ncbi:MAG TPA: hypothetical protein VHX12_12375 [Acidisoma sp.]|nr:hypothetical protein [Acidisoma sp.]
MIRQYYAQRCRGGYNPLRIGVIPRGAIFYIQSDSWWRDRYRGRPICREPWIVEAFLNGTIGAGRRNRDTGFWESVYISGRSDMAVICSLRSNRRREILVQTLILHEDLGLRADDGRYPTLPAIKPSRTSVPAAA